MNLIIDTSLEKNLLQIEFLHSLGYQVGMQALAVDGSRDMEVWLGKGRHDLVHDFFHSMRQQRVLNQVFHGILFFLVMGHVLVLHHFSQCDGGTRIR